MSKILNEAQTEVIKDTFDELFGAISYCLLAFRSMVIGLAIDVSYYPEFRLGLCIAPEGNLGNTTKEEAAEEIKLNLGEDFKIIIEDNTIIIDYVGKGKEYA